MTEQKDRYFVQWQRASGDWVDEEMNLKQGYPDMNSLIIALGACKLSDSFKYRIIVRSHYREWSEEKVVDAHNPV